MRKTLLTSSLLVLSLLLTGAEQESCEGSNTPTSASGVSKAEIQISTGADGYTVEQRNVRDRLIEDNKPGAIKHLYVISAYSGQVLIYSTVRGKVSSGGKRLTPTTVATASVYTSVTDGMFVNLGDHKYVTSEVLQDDGTYGTSGDYLFWWDTRGVYHQHYVQGGQIVHISSEPIAVKSVVINMELDGTGQAGAGPTAKQ